TQYTYGSQIENLLGVAGRYCTANLEAFEKLPWNQKELAVIEEQRSYAVPIPEVPGAYFIPRSIDSAFRDVQNKGKNPRTCWTREIANINKELDRKNKELGTGKYATLN
ncbi:MAG: ABC transporter substrate-binding protein, partial [Clostridia bacterium]